MNTENDFNELLIFFKTLADQNRLKIIGFLAEQSLSVEQIASKLGLSSSTVSHHLSRLAKAGLVSARASGYYNYYQLETKALEAMAQRLLTQDVAIPQASENGPDDYDKKVLSNYLTADHRIKRFPNKEKKLNAILRYVTKVFEPGKRYSEKQVNELLAQFSDDTAFLRRSLVEIGLMQRQGGGGDYWLSEPEPEN